MASFTHCNDNVEPDFADIIVKACCVLHNFVRRRDGFNFEDTLSNNLDDLENNNNKNGSQSQGKDIRNNSANYFMEARVTFSYLFRIDLHKLYFTLINNLYI